MRSRGFAVLLRFLPQLVLELRSCLPNLSHVHLIESLGYLPGLELRFPALRPAFEYRPCLKWAAAIRAFTFFGPRPTSSAVKTACGRDHPVNSPCTLPWKGLSKRRISCILFVTLGHHNIATRSVEL